MFGEGNLQSNSPKILEYDLNRYFGELLKFESIEETEKSAVYQKIKPTVERILNAVVQENFAENQKPVKEETPDTSHCTDAEIVYRVNKPKHVGLILYSNKCQRLAELLQIYRNKIANDFLAIAPVKGKM